MPGLILRSVIVPEMGACKTKRLSVRRLRTPRLASFRRARSASLRAWLRLSSACSCSLRGAMPLSIVPLSAGKSGRQDSDRRWHLHMLLAPAPVPDCPVQPAHHLCEHTLPNARNSADHSAGNRRGNTNGTGFVISDLAGDGVHQRPLNQFNSYFFYILRLGESSLSMTSSLG